VLLLDTVSKIANFLPPSVSDPSFRYVTKSTNLYPPYWTIDLWDVLSIPTDAHLIFDVYQKNVDVSSFLHTFFCQGRVLWGRTLDLLDDETQSTAVFRAVTS